jgi:hypothetical protein
MMVLVSSTRSRLMDFNKDGLEMRALSGCR